MTEINSLIQPTELTFSLSLFLILILFSIAYMGYKLKNAVILFTWAIDIIILMLTILINFSFIYFWSFTIIGIFTIMIVAVYRYLVIR